MNMHAISHCVAQCKLQFACARGLCAQLLPVASAVHRPR